MSDDDKELHDLVSIITLDALNNYYESLIIKEDYDTAELVKHLELSARDNYVDFRLKEYDSEGRALVREVYTNILGYNPNNPKQIK
jgi:hypothetical protein